jgi:hypothetical protein
VKLKDPATAVPLSSPLELRDNPEPFSEPDDIVNVLPLQAVAVNDCEMTWPEVYAPKLLGVTLHPPDANLYAPLSQAPLEGRLFAVLNVGT